MLVRAHERTNFVLMEDLSSKPLSTISGATLEKAKKVSVRVLPGCNNLLEM